MNNNQQSNFDQWCVVELFGHQVTAGRVTEQVIGGQAFLRVDVPECDSRPAFTKFYGSSAIYAITPVSEDVARAVVRAKEPEPVTVYVPELRQLAAVNRRPIDDEESEDDYERRENGPDYNPDDAGPDPEDVPF